MSEREGHVRVYAIAPRITRLGPGLRFGIWLQGCPFRCDGCVVPESLPLDGGRVHRIEEIAAQITADPALDGLSVSGGEPFAQPAALAALLGVARDRALNTIVFSGFTLRALRHKAKRDAHVADALDRIDLLVDGQFESTGRGRFGMRGSTNQAYNFLTPALVAQAEEIAGYDKGRFEVAQTKSGPILVGLPIEETEPFWEHLTDYRGI